jgi:hypothetical protein
MTIQYNRNFGDTIPFSDTAIQVALAANTDLSYTIPGTAINKYTVKFGYTSTSNIFVCKNAVAVVPGAGTVATQQYNEFKPGFDGSSRSVQGGDVLHFITPDASAYFGFSLMAVPG